MDCLLCHETCQEKAGFLSIFLLKRTENAICQTCRDSFERLDGNLCARCCKPSDDEVCQDCLLWEKQGYLVQHQALYRYNSAMKEYFKQYKFLGDYLLREVFAGELRQALKAYKDYTIVPVSVSLETWSDRGFNQVTGLLDAAGISYQDCLSKEEAVKQSHLTRQERLALKNHYALTTEEALPERVLLVDDVYTTGATITSIALLFHEKGVKDVKTFSLAR